MKPRPAGTGASQSYRGIGGLSVTITEKAPTSLLTVRDGMQSVILTQAVRLQGPDEDVAVATAARRVPVVFRYAGASSHPAGDQAPLSWINGEGRGLIRVVEPGKRILVLPLVGRLASEHAPIAPRTGSRGPSRSSDLWLTVAAWCQSGGFSPGSIAKATGISGVTVWKWMQDVERLGFIAQDPQSKRTAYVLRRSQYEALGHLVAVRWAEWRRGTGVPALRPSYRYFTATDDWKHLYPIVRKQGIRCFPTGLTVLEGGPMCAPKAWIMPGGLLPELQLYVAASHLQRLIASGRLVLRAERERDDDSAVCVLRDDHPAMRLYEHRAASASCAHPWPWGIAALDAMDHRDPRVSQAAREAWRAWVDGQDDGRSDEGSR